MLAQHSDMFTKSSDKLKHPGCIFTRMIGFVTWPPFSYQNYYKGG